METLNWVTIGVCGVLLIACVYLLSYHVYLICNNMTTYKHIRSKHLV